MQGGQRRACAVPALRIIFPFINASRAIANLNCRSVGTTKIV
jgi:hypothetical protein